ncbi:MAG TPA: 4-hydroxyphenylacetate 3-hydroxylase N-terminal domain-containing protein [Anaerolineales bacterium]|nr:4-hydroxyphenylacetate 3-hydroxylase N-terminal domain-containing protein [Anaerolineales bacterium]
MNQEIITSEEDYLTSLRGRKLNIYLMGEQVDEPLDHPMLRPSINAMAMTYALAQANPDLATSISPLTGQRINRFLHIATSCEDVVQQNRMQRRLGQLTGTCFQRCVGMDALNSLYSVTYEIDTRNGTSYHARLLEFIKQMQVHNYVIGGAMTDVKGDRSKSPSTQADPDLYLHITRRTDDGVYVTGAKAHQTGCINSHWLIVMPTLRLQPGEEDYAVVGALPIDAKGITYVVGRQSCDTRILEGQMDAGNAEYSGQEALIIFEDVFIPNEHIFMNGEIDFTAMLVERFTAFHRRSYVCKAGVGDVLIGAAATAAEYNGVDKASHIRDKLVEMTHLNETIYATGIASSYQSKPTASGAYLCDELLANVCKQNVTRITYEMARLAQDLAGGLLVTMPSEADFRHKTIGPLVDKYLKGKADVETENRMRILRLIENITLGRNAVGYLTESLHGAGSPQAQRIRIQRQMDLEFKQGLAKKLAGIEKE